MNIEQEVKKLGDKINHLKTNQDITQMQAMVNKLIDSNNLYLTEIEKSFNEITNFITQQKIVEQSKLAQTQRDCICIDYKTFSDVINSLYFAEKYETTKVGLADKLVEIAMIQNPDYFTVETKKVEETKKIEETKKVESNILKNIKSRGQGIGIENTENAEDIDEKRFNEFMRSLITILGLSDNQTLSPDLLEKIFNKK